MLPETVAAAPKGQPQLQWLRERWTDRGGGVIGANDIDTSLRCEGSGICEGIAACKPGERLLCFFPATPFPDRTGGAFDFGCHNLKP